jgi:hypothetical protein
VEESRILTHPYGPAIRFFKVYVAQDGLEINSVKVAWEGALEEKFPG